MDKGAQFAIDNSRKVLDLVESHPEYQSFKRIVLAEYNRIKYIKYTGNMYDYFAKFKNGTHKYANDFAFLSQYGLLPNEKVADYLAQHFPDELNHRIGIKDLKIGQVYSNAEIVNIFQCSYMGGMRRSLATNSLVLIAKHDNDLYSDAWDKDGIMNYTGMGMIGDQKLDYAQNRTLVESRTNGVKVYLFESFKDNAYTYDGPVELAGEIFTTTELGANGLPRKVIKFPLRKINVIPEP